MKVALIFEDIKPLIYQIDHQSLFITLGDMYRYYNKELAVVFTKALQANDLNLLAKFDLDNRRVYVYDYEDKKRFTFQWSARLILRKINNNQYYKDKGFIFPKVVNHE